MSNEEALALATEALMKLVKDKPNIIRSGASSGTIGSWSCDYFSGEQKAKFANANDCLRYISAYPCNNKRARKFWRSVIDKAVANGLV